MVFLKWDILTKIFPFWNALFSYPVELEMKNDLGKGERGIFFPSLYIFPEKNRGRGGRERKETETGLSKNNNKTVKI